MWASVARSVVTSAAMRRKEALSARYVFSKASQSACRLYLGPACFGYGLDGFGELDLQSAGQVEAMLGLHYVGNPALARLAVDTDDRLVGPAGVFGVDRQIGDLPLARTASGRAAIPFLMASWWEPEKAV